MENEGQIGMNVIRVDSLRRSYGDIEAVKGVSFEVLGGEIFGFLGPNGAGKTTTIHMLCTLLRPDGGTAKVAGYDIRSEPNDVRRSIGVVFQESSLDEQLTGRENLRFHAMLYNMERDRFNERADRLLELVELDERADEQVRTFSGGMKRRLELARGLLHEPKVLFLDEPTLGLDPQTRRHIWDYLRQLRDREQVTIFMTTHYMDEAEACDRVAIMDHGEIIALDSPEQLKGTVGGDVVSAYTNDNPAALERLSADGVIDSRLGPDGALVIEVDQGDAYIPKMMKRLTEESPSIEVNSVSLRRPTLEDVFIKLTGRAIREETADELDRMRQRSRRGR
ncbi:MAG: ATP-binding cassette domain-containing protein [Anaerolineales bacterium]